MDSFECRDCGEVYPESQKVCPKCGSTHKIVYISGISAKIELKARIEGMQGKNLHLPSKKKLRWEWVSKDTVQRGDGVTRIHLYRFRDRDNNIYEESVTDLETGGIIHECKEPLSEHRGHGSDKDKHEQGEH